MLSHREAPMMMPRYGFQWSVLKTCEAGQSKILLRTELVLKMLRHSFSEHECVIDRIETHIFYLDLIFRALIGYNMVSPKLFSQIITFLITVFLSIFMTAN